MSLKNETVETRLDNIEEIKYYLFAEIDASKTLKNIKYCYAQACELLDSIKVVLVFEKLHAKRKRR